MRPSRRHFLIVLPGLLAFAQETRKTAPQTVVFVCEHGSAKSVIAAAHFNRLAKAQGLPYQAVARGADPDQEIPDNVKRGLAADGLDVSAWKPQRVQEEDVRKSDRVITFACTLPVSDEAKGDKVTDWQDIPPVGENYETARKAIVERVTDLLKGLGSK